VDGSHIRTLVLTFLYRHMPELIERGHVYIAVPPLYLVKLGNQEYYFEKDAQFEDLLVRERVGALEIAARDGTPVKFTEARWAKFVRTLAELEGWSARLRADYGPAATELLIAHRIVEARPETEDDLVAAIAAETGNGYSLSVLERDETTVRVKVIEKETSAAHNVSLPLALVSSPVLANVRRSYERLAEQVGLPPFAIRHGKKAEAAESFEELRHATLELAKEGMHVSRFKGLGEMNAEQLWETTMDPSRRLLIRVEVEDATTADALFATLMGDQVEPRRAFIEQNARDVRFLDV
jgi:DNA gyrase subunit B